MLKASTITPLRIVFGLLGIAGIIIQFQANLARGETVANILSYFSYQANILAVSLLVVAVYAAVGGRRPQPWVDTVRGCAFVAMLIVGLVFNILLRGPDPGGLSSVANNIMHVVMPLAICVDYILVPPRQPVTLRTIGGWLLFPLGYLAYSLIRDPIVGWYPYYFLNPDKVGNAGIALYSLAILALFFGLAFIARALANRPLKSS